MGNLCWALPEIKRDPSTACALLFSAMWSWLCRWDYQPNIIAQQWNLYFSLSWFTTVRIPTLTVSGIFGCDYVKCILWAPFLWHSPLDMLISLSVYDLSTATCELFSCHWIKSSILACFVCYSNLILYSRLCLHQLSIGLSLDLAFAWLW